MSRREAHWVSKTVVVDRRKLDVARRAFRVQTDAEAIDLALDLVVWRRELERGFTAVRRSGGIEDRFERYG